MASLRPREELPGRGLLVEVVGGDHDGELLVLVSEHRGARCRRASELVGPCEISAELLASLARVESGRGGSSQNLVPRSTRGRTRQSNRPSRARSPSSRRSARRLLESLLDERQLASWRDCRRFDVAVADGTVELGELYNLRYRRIDGRDFALCVVPRSHESLPIEDIWVNLLLVLRSDPDEFFRVANYRRYGMTEGFCPGPAPRRLSRRTFRTSLRGHRAALRVSRPKRSRALALAQSTPPETIELATIPLRRTAARGVANKHRRFGASGRDHLCVLHKARLGDHRPDPFVDQAADLQSSFPSMGARRNQIADFDRGRRLCPRAVESYVPTAARLCRRRAGLEDPHRPEPAVEPRRLHGEIVARHQEAMSTPGKHRGAGCRPRAAVRAGLEKRAAARDRPPEDRGARLRPNPTSSSSRDRQKSAGTPRSERVQ